MHYARIAAVITLVASNLATGSVDASSPTVSDARAPVEVVEISTGREQPLSTVPPIQDVAYPSIRVENVTVHAVEDDDLNRGQSAVELLSSRGFELSALDVYIHPTRHGCSRAPGDLQRSGVYIQRADGGVVHVCGPDFVLFHELAHVWEVATMSDADRGEFLAIREADYWSGDEWERAAGEHVADVIAWASLDGEVRPSRTKPNDDSSLQTAYDVLVSFTK